MSHHESAARGPDARMVDRMLFFSDAVFAIVLTLLAIELHPPELEEFSDASFWVALGHMAPEFFAFGLSFLLIGLWWVIHMRMTRKLIVFDWLTAWCNLLLLGCVTLIPFGTTSFGSHFTSMAGIQVYWTIMTAAALAMTLMFIVISRGKGRLIGGISAREWWARLITSMGPVVAFAAGAYFAATEQVWPSRFAAFIMFPFMLAPMLFYRPGKT